MRVTIVSFLVRRIVDLGLQSGLWGANRRASRLTTETVGKLSGTVRDAIRVLGDIAHFQQQERRLRDFERAMRRLYSEDKRTLARILKQKLRPFYVEDLDLSSARYRLSFAHLDSVDRTLGA